MPSKRKSSACVDYVPALCTHRSLLPIEWSGEASDYDSLTEGEVVTRFPLGSPEKQSYDCRITNGRLPGGRSFGLTAASLTSSPLEKGVREGENPVELGFSGITRRSRGVGLFGNAALSRWGKRFKPAGAPRAVAHYTRPGLVNVVRFVGYHYELDRGLDVGGRFALTWSRNTDQGV
ncbi:unnamed protein product [Bathycoccus prasinos]